MSFPYKCQCGAYHASQTDMTQLPGGFRTFSRLPAKSKRQIPAQVKGFVPSMFSPNEPSSIDQISEGTWIVMIHATWCPHCVAAMPAFLEFAKTAPQTATVDGDKYPALAKQLGADGFPTFVQYKNGKSTVISGDRTAAVWSKYI